MSYPVRLYVYDLSQGMARQMSMMLTGKQLDGIWYVPDFLNCNAELTFQAYVSGRLRQRGVLRPGYL